MPLPNRRSSVSSSCCRSLRTGLLPDEESGETTFRFDNWNADACYAHDPCGNIVEVIAHHELPEESPESPAFSADELLGLCELGLVGADLRKMANALDTLGILCGTGPWMSRDGLLSWATAEGVLILSQEGRGWMPTGRAAERHPVEALVSGERNAQVTLPGTRHRITTTTSFPSSFHTPR
jgi:hypothetical protein